MVIFFVLFWWFFITIVCDLLFNVEPVNYFLLQEKLYFFKLETVNFAAEKFCYILHRHVCVM